MSRRGLQAVLLILGLVAVTFGTLTVLTGGSLVLDGGRVSASVDSELRFYAAWYAAAGVMVLRAVPRVESAGTTIRAICAVLIIAACARVLSIIVVGTPHPIFLALMGVEITIPVVVVPWQAAVARRGN
jgi:presenilin-like A22 family membrane protease